MAAPSSLTKTEAGHFEEFYKRYGAIEDRFQVASNLANPANNDTAQEPYFSRLYLAAHWGANELELRSTAKRVYELKDRAGAHKGQTVIAFNSGTPEEALDPDTSFAFNPVSFDIGRIVSGDVVHLFRGGSSRLDPGTQGPTYPTLAYGEGIPVDDRQTATFDCNFVGIRRKPRELLVIERGVSPLIFADDAKAYKAKHRTEELPVIWGNIQCYDFLKALARKSSREAEGRFYSMERSGEITRGQYLPNIAQIFSANNIAAPIPAA